MLDDFREQANRSFDNEEEAPPLEPEVQIRRPFLGMTPAQRLVIMILFLGLTCLLSTLCLLATNKVVLPF